MWRAVREAVWRMPVGQGGGGGGRRATVRSQVESAAELRPVQCTFSEPTRRYGGVFKAKELPAVDTKPILDEAWPCAEMRPRCQTRDQPRCAGASADRPRTCLEPSRDSFAPQECHSRCVKPWKEYEKCEARIEKAGEGNCASWYSNHLPRARVAAVPFPNSSTPPSSRYSDYVHCVDTCGAKVLFATLR